MISAVYGLLCILSCMQHSAYATGIDLFDMDQFAQEPTYGPVARVPHDILHSAETGMAAVPAYMHVYHVVATWFVFRYCSVRSWFKQAMQRLYTSRESVQA